MDKQIIETLGKKLIKQKPLVDKISISEYDPSDVAPPFKSMEWRGFPIYYDDIEHLYFTVQKDVRIPLLSTTTIWGLFEKPFDEKGMSEYCAQKGSYDCNCLDKKDWDSLDVKRKATRIRRAWKKNNKEATDYGSAAHEVLEMAAKHPELTDKEIITQISYTSGKRAVRPIVKTFLKNFRPLLQKYIDAGFEVVAEPLLVLLEFGIAGQADLVLIHHGRKEIVLLDYKTNKRKPSEEDAFGFMLEPFHSYPDGALTHYSLQQATYGEMLKSMYPGYALRSMNLLWLNPESGDIEPVEIPMYWTLTVREYLQEFKGRGILSGAYDMMKRKFKMSA